MEGEGEGEGGEVVGLVVALGLLVFRQEDPFFVVDVVFPLPSFPSLSFSPSFKKKGVRSRLLFLSFFSLSVIVVVCLEHVIFFFFF